MKDLTTVAFRMYLKTIHTSVLTIYAKNRLQQIIHTEIKSTYYMCLMDFVFGPHQIS